MTLETAIAETATVLNIDTSLALSLVTRIDVLKIKGYTAGEAASHFADYLGFLGLPDDEASHELFATRWMDHKVWIKIPEDLKHYLNSDTPLFTQAREEPIYRKTPFYAAGITKTPLGVLRNPEDGGSVRKAPALDEGLDNFIIHQFLPDVFYLEVANNQVQSVLNLGLPAQPNGDDAYKIYLDAESARSNLSIDLMTADKELHTARPSLTDYTLIQLEVSKMEINNDAFYTKNITGHKGRTGNLGYFYVGHVPASGCKVSRSNKTT